jgi:putative chitinase
VPETLPEHPLYRQASDGLARLGPVAALSGPDRHADAAAAIALSAAEQGMTRIDHVLPSRDGHGLFLVQGEDPAAPHAKRARVEIADLAPAEQSLERLGAQRQTLAFEPERSFDRQQDETRAQGAPAIAPRSL